MNLSVLPGAFAICRFSSNTVIPQTIYASSFYAITKTAEELSLVVESTHAPENAIKIEKSWKILKVEGPLDFALTGILSALIKPLAEAEISIFAISTFDTDYIMVKEEKLELAVNVLKNLNHAVI